MAGGVAPGAGDRDRRRNASVDELIRLSFLFSTGLPLVRLYGGINIEIVNIANSRDRIGRLFSSLQRTKTLCEEAKMKLYGIDLSNFTSKCRIVMYEKGLSFEKINPPGGMGSAEYKKLNPVGKIPALQLDNGQVIAESEVINEYL